MKAIVTTFTIPLIITKVAKLLFLIPLTNYIWNTQQHELFLNLDLEFEALTQLQNFEEILYFDYFLIPINYKTSYWGNKNISINVLDFPIILTNQLQEKTFELAEFYNKHSVETLTNFFGDLITISTFVLVIIILKSQVIVFKTFIVEFIYSFSDSLKSALLILSTNLLVGFHSPRGWELFLNSLLNRFGFAANENFIFLFVATFPVLLDTIFKYWIFRYLNKISPSTVATYHSMIQ